MPILKWKTPKEGSLGQVESQQRFEQQLFDVHEQRQQQQQQQQVPSQEAYIKQVIKNQIIKHHGVYQSSQELPHDNVHTKSKSQTATETESEIPAEKKTKTKPKYLYDTKLSHPIVEYKPTKEEIESESLTPSFVLEVTWPRVIQFYHPSSPHCQAFQSTFVSLARGIRHRSSRLPVEFYAVNCGRYRGICEEGFNIKSVPSLIGFKSGSIQHRDFSLPGKADDSDKIRMSKEEKSKDLELKLEHVAKLLGFKLDVWTKNSPGALLGAADGVDNAGLHLGRGLGKNGVAVDRFNGDGDEIDANEFREDNFASPSEQAFQDATSSIIITLTSSIYSQFPHGSALPHDTTDALREFIDLIRWAFPPETKVHELAEDLKVDFFSASTSEDGMMKVVGRHFDLGDSVPWSPRCNGSGIGSRSDHQKGGYACGVWSLLHILSLGVAERHTAVIGDVERVTPHHAGHVMRTFVDKFFIGCDSCRKVWIELYDEACCGLYGADNSLSLELSEDPQWRNLAVWIWEVHNEITIRRQNSSGKGYFQRQTRIASSSYLWPSRENCPSCWPIPAKGSGQLTNMDSFDRNALYDHLKRNYWQSGVHNNRLIVLDRWTQTKRALSLKRMRDRLTSRWYFSLIMNILMVWMVLYLCKMLCQLLRCGKRKTNARIKKTYPRGRKNLDEMLDELESDDIVDEYDSNTRHHASHSSYNMGRLRNSRYRTNRMNGSSSMMGGRRYRSGSGFQSTNNQHMYFQL